MHSRRKLKSLRGWLALALLVLLGCRSSSPPRPPATDPAASSSREVYPNRD